MSLSDDSGLSQCVTDALRAAPEGHEYHAIVMAMRLGLRPHKPAYTPGLSTPRECSAALISSAERAGKTRREVLLAR